MPVSGLLNGSGFGLYGIWLKVIFFVTSNIRQFSSLWQGVHLPSASVLYSISKKGYKSTFPVDLVIGSESKQKIFAGMIPKLDNAFAALNSGVKKVIIGKAEELTQLIHGKTGTVIINE